VNGASLAGDRLDDQQLVEAGDPAGVLREVASAAARVRIAVRTARESGLDALDPGDRPRAIVVVGTSLAGDMLAALCGAASPVQILSVPGDRLPGWIGAADLVIGTDGDDHAVLEACRQASRRGCQLVGIGGAEAPLRDLTGGLYLPATPGLWPVLIGLTGIVERLGLLRVGEDGYEDTATALEDIAHRCRPASESFVNPAKSLALDMVTSVPVVWGAGLAEVGARWFASQLRCVAKCPAVSGSLAAAVDGQAGVLEGAFAPGPDRMFYDDEEAGPSIRLVLLADPAGEHQRTVALRRAAGELAREHGVRVSELAAEGERPLRRLATLVQFADYASVYLAIACGLDPAAAASAAGLRDAATRIA
jgi:glucose/mannose-6-phosphate isomerase